MENVVYETVGTDQLLYLTHELIRRAADAGDPLTVIAIGAIGGDRATCCDEAVTVRVDNVLVGIATIAPKGESGDSSPEIVGIFVALEFRRHGFGEQLFIRVLGRMRERGFTQMRATLLTRGIKRVWEGLPDDMKMGVDICDYSTSLPF